MLRAISIQNFALIEDLEMEFNQGFTSLTGETGAGKSILLDALSLALGQRADRSALRNAEKKCVVEITIWLASPKLELLFKREEIDFENETILRREILPSGKSRAFINDSPVTLELMKDVGEQLIDIHTQFQSRQLIDTNFHFHLIDSVAKNETLLAGFQSNLKAYRNNEKALTQLLASQESAKQDLSYHQFLFDELVQAQLKEGQQEIWETEVQALDQSEEIKEALVSGQQILEIEEHGILDQLALVRNNLQRIQNISPRLQEIYTRIQSCWLELDDLRNELESQADQVVDDPARLQLLQEKLQNLYALQKKHQVNSITELLRVKSELAVLCDQNISLDSRITELKRVQEELFSKLENDAQQLSKKRLNVANDLASNIVSQLSLLGIKNASMKFDFQNSQEFNLFGKQTLEVLFSANKGVDFAPLKKVASGGEQSRIMLVIKSIMAQNIQLPTLILDEIDTGVSGEVSHNIGQLLLKMSESMQLLVITHAPQIAAKGHQQLKIFKQENQGKTTSHLKVLDREERIKELAQMLDGDSPSETAIQHARELVN